MRACQPSSDKNDLRPHFAGNDLCHDRELFAQSVRRIRDCRLVRRRHFFEFVGTRKSGLSRLQEIEVGGGSSSPLAELWRPAISPIKRRLENSIGFRTSP